MAVNNTERYYVHGDCHEEKEGQFYCAFCDLFLPDSHFHDGSHTGHYARYESSLTAFKSRIKNGSTYSRPMNPFNLVA